MFLLNIFAESLANYTHLLQEMSTPYFGQELERNHLDSLTNPL